MGKIIQTVAKMHIKKHDPGAQDEGFHGKVKEAIASKVLIEEQSDEDEATLKELEELFERQLDFTPDLYSIDEEKRRIRIYEIEDMHPLSDDKLMKIVSWSISLVNDCGWGVSLFVSDRFGLSIRELPLKDIYEEVRSVKEWYE